MASDSDKIKLLEFLLKLEADHGFLKDFVEADDRASVVADVGFEDPRIAEALANMDSVALQKFMNPTMITIKGWVKIPPWS